MPLAAGMWGGDLRLLVDVSPGSDASSPKQRPAGCTDASKIQCLSPWHGLVASSARLCKLGPPLQARPAFAGRLLKCEIPRCFGVGLEAFGSGLLGWIRLLVGLAKSAVPSCWLLT